MNLTDREYIMELMRARGLSFNKALGQNFLINAEIPKKIAAYAVCAAADKAAALPDALEIGPGAGCLTAELAKVCRRVVAVEIDGGFADMLGELFREVENIKIINTDFLSLDIDSLAVSEFANGYIVCANLPYCITTEAVEKLITARYPPTAVVIMVQKEAAKRLCALPGDSLYCEAAALVRLYGEATRLFDVSAGNFIPRPTVDSTVMRITRRQGAEGEKSPAELTLIRRVIRGAFASRRKTIVNSLAGEFESLGRAELAEAAQRAGIDSGVRGETLGNIEFTALARELAPLINAEDGVRKRRNNKREKNT